MSELLELHKKKKELDNQIVDQIELLDYLEACEMCIFFIKKQLKSGAAGDLIVMEVNKIIERFERAKEKTNKKVR